MKKKKWIITCLLVLCFCVSGFSDDEREGCFIRKKIEFLKFFNSVISEGLFSNQDELKRTVKNLRFFSDVSAAAVISDKNRVKAVMDSKEITIDEYVKKAVAQAKKKKGIVILRKKKKGDLRFYVFVSPIYNNSSQYQGCSLVEFSVKPCSH